MNYEDDFKIMVPEMVFEYRINEQLLKNFITYFEEMNLEKGIKYFYSKGVYPDENLILFFFYEDKIRSVSFDKENNDFKISTYFDSISNIDLRVIPSSELKRELTITLNSLEKIVLLPENDTTMHWVKRYVKTIEEIYKYLS